jgi:hypothetical protein
MKNPSSYITFTHICGQCVIVLNGIRDYSCRWSHVEVGSSSGAHERQLKS